MDIKNLSKEELELMSYTDIAYVVLQEKKSSISTLDLLTKIYKVLDIVTNDITEKLADFFSSLVLDKRFILLSDGKWDLKVKHSSKIVIDDDLDEESEGFAEEEEIKEEEDVDFDAELEQEYSVAVDEEEVDDDDDDELDDLAIVDEDELEL